MKGPNLTICVSLPWYFQKRGIAMSWVLKLLLRWIIERGLVLSNFKFLRSKLLRSRSKLRNQKEKILGKKELFRSILRPELVQKKRGKDPLLRIMRVSSKLKVEAAKLVLGQKLCSLYSVKNQIWQMIRKSKKLWTSFKSSYRTQLDHL